LNDSIFYHIFFFHTVNETSIRVVVGRLAQEEIYQNERIKPVILLPFCLIIFVWTCSSLVGNLAHITTRLYLSNESFFLIRSCVFLCSQCAFIFVVGLSNNTLSTTFTNETTALRILWCVSLFFQNTHDPMFTKIS